MPECSFLSTPVLMHGGLICIAFCPSVRCHWTKIQNQDVVHFTSSTVALSVQVGYSLFFILQIALHVYQALAGGLTPTSSCIFIYDIKILATFFLEFDIKVA